MGEPVFASEYDKYLAYLKSARWDELRTERIKMDNFQCRLCGNPHQLHVHHLYYPETLGTETVNDLITLCADCHKTIETLKQSGEVKRKQCAIRMVVWVRFFLESDEGRYEKIISELTEFKSDKDSAIPVNAYIGEEHLCRHTIIRTDIESIPKMQKKFGPRNVKLEIDKSMY